MKRNIYILAAIMFCGIALAACSDKDNDIVNPDPATVETVCTPSLPQSCTLTINATKGNDASLSKALSLDGKTLNASWAKGEKVAVYNGDTQIGELTAEDDGTTTTLSGLLDPAPNVGDGLTLKFNETDYRGQDGTLETIAEKFDYAIANVQIESITDGKATANDAVFENQQAVVKFTLSCNGTDINAISLSVNDIAATLTSAANEVFVAIPAEKAKDISLSVYDGSFVYNFNKTGANFANGKFYSIKVSNLTKNSATYDLSSGNSTIIIPNGSVLTGTFSGSRHIGITDGATVTLYNVNLEQNTDGINCYGDATIILEGENTVIGNVGIVVAPNKTLTIDGAGTLNVTGKRSAGIGGSGGEDSGNIIINGGNITATSEKRGAGIGGGSAKTCGDITINGGVVTATALKDGAGIGSGSTSTCGDITINGGVVTATAWKDGAGIGSGNNATCGKIRISGGSVTAIGGECAGIGSGNDATCGDVIISGGTVTATGGEYAAGIGSNTNSTCGKIKISDGTVKAVGGQRGAGIGAGYSVDSFCGDIEISGGSVTAIGGDEAAGIGSACRAGDQNLFNITISGGEIEATGGANGAGIGSSNKSAYGNITISGGKIKATGGENGSGIGGGNKAINCGTIAIKDSEIEAAGGANGAGIGGGETYPQNPNSITITNSTVIATGGENAAGIGGNKYNCCAITITNSTVTATGGDYGAGIGTGNGSYCNGDITINGNNVTAIGGKYGAGIGTGNNGKILTYKIKIKSGIVTATGGDYGAGIGNGANWVFSLNNKIEISGGQVTAKGGTGAEDIGNGVQNPDEGSNPDE